MMTMIHMVSCTVHGEFVIHMVCCADHDDHDNHDEHGELC